MLVVTDGNHAATLNPFGKQKHRQAVNPMRQRGVTVLIFQVPKRRPFAAGIGNFQKVQPQIEKMFVHALL